MEQIIVKGKYISYIPKNKIEANTDELYSIDKFNKWYDTNPDRLTPTQIKMCGGVDKLKEQLKNEYMCEKYTYKSKTIEEEKNKVLSSIMKPIQKLADMAKKSGLHVNVEIEEKVPLIIFGNLASKLRISITLADDINRAFCVAYNTSYFKYSQYVNDVDLIKAIKKYIEYEKTGVKPKGYTDFIYHRVDNQFHVLCLDKRIEDLADIEIIQLYNNLAKEMNKKFGENHPYSQAMIDKIKPCENRFHEVGEFYLGDKYNNKFQLLASYYDKEFHSYTNWENCGYWSKNELEHLLSILKPYIMNNWFVDKFKDRNPYSKPSELLFWKE